MEPATPRLVVWHLIHYTTAYILFLNVEDTKQIHRINESWNGGMTESRTSLNIIPNLFSMRAA